MKEIDLKVIKTNVGEDEVDLSYKAQLIHVMTTPSVGPDGQSRGAGIDEQRRSIRVIDVLELADEPGIMALEDADFDYMKARVLQTLWPFISKDLVQFIDDVTVPLEEN